MPLTNLKVRNAGPGKHSDVHGLYLFVRPSGSRSRMLRMQFKGKRRDFGQIVERSVGDNVGNGSGRQVAVDYREGASSMGSPVDPSLLSPPPQRSPSPPHVL